MKKILFLLLTITLISQHSFSQLNVSELRGPRPAINLAAIPEDAYEKGIINIKFKPSVENLLSIYPGQSPEGFARFGIPSVDALNKQYKVGKALLAFISILDKSNNFTERHKQWGFHLWYQLKFPDNINIKEMVGKYQLLTDVVEIAEPIYKAARIGDRFVPNKNLPGNNLHVNGTSPLTTIPNDTRFNEQWHYKNTGQNGGTPNDDIHLPEAWDLEMGKPNVIVGLVDGGVQVNHPDIAANMWPTNGFNFVNNTTILDADEHGSHTGGTIAAVTNNGVGVSGVAGGNGTPGSGVRLMSLEIFGPNGTGATAANIGAAYIWSADRGAAISSNSWGYITPGVFDQIVLDGIDYFIAHGGGTVMTGGLVVFAAGNDNLESAHYPGFYAKTLAVAATNNKDVRAYYSNFGTWVDISAPGGEQFVANDPKGVLSTTFGSSYEFLQGTSMATPHVAGVAALIASKAPGVFTADQVRNILLTTVDDHYPVNLATYAGKLGTGRLNAFKALQQVVVLIGPVFARDASLSAIIDPNAFTSYCNLPIIPKVTITNKGTDTLKNVQVGVILDNVNLGNNTFTNLGLLKDAFTTVTLTISLSPTSGQHTVKIYTFNPNGAADQRTSNDTLTRTFTVLQTLPLPNTEGFESITFPPTGGWSVSNPDGAITWARTTAAAKTGTASMWIDGWDYGPGAEDQVDIFKSPRIDILKIDTLTLKFDVAYAQFNAFPADDTLEVVYSLDCGTTWLPTGYKKWGAALATAPPNNAALFVPTAAQWRTETVKMTNFCNIPATSLLMGVKFTNEFGQALYIDNLNLTGAGFQRNLVMQGISQPTDICVNTFTPVVSFTNRGSDTVYSATINYSVDGGAISTFAFTGTVAKCSTQVVTLPPITSVNGAHVISVYTSNPNGLPDQFPSNDTARKAFNISSTVINSPISEGFEGAVFPPLNWFVSNPDNSLTWERTTVAAKTGAASMVIRNFSYPTSGTIDRFYSAIIAPAQNVDSFFVSFDYAYSPGAMYPGSTALPLDTLEVQITQDCGATYTTIWKKWGEDLQSIGDPNGANYPSGVSFVSSAAQWKNVRLYISPVIKNQNFQVHFVARSNKQNNLYVDNINVFSQTLPQRLKNQGYLIYPNPFTGSFKIHHFQPPVDLQTVGVYNSVGQKVWEINLNGQGNTEMNVNLGKLAAGVYIIKLQYLNKTVVEKIVKE